MIGQTLGHYRIESKLGEGGMGVVYRAVDTHLDRPVAVKVLRPEAISSPDRKRRFVQEAKSASALNHSNIIHVYDIDTAADGDIDYIAMEFVSGRTLDHHIRKHRLPLRDTLSYAIQISDALARAHDAGIIHRDLKPANIMIGDDSRVRVLDFGLAKLVEKIQHDDAGTATLTAHTEEGTIVGTVAYMSPEQVEGRKLDARSDIFSFGSLLYEMVTGRRPFQGTTNMSTLSAILQTDPKPATEIAPDVPPELEKIISRCLRKDRERRTQHMSDVKLALEDLKEESESGKLAQIRSANRAPSRRLWILASLSGATALAALGIWTKTLRNSDKPSHTPTLTRLTSDSGLATHPTLSPDGKFLAYASDRSGDGNLDLWVQQLAGGEPFRLTRHEGDDHEPSFSPDGSKIIFRSERDGGGVYVVSTLGGDARLIARHGRSPRYSPDGTQIAYWVGQVVGDLFNRGTGMIYLTPSTGGSPRQLQPHFVAARYPVWLPDGEHILFVATHEQSSADERWDWWITHVDKGNPVKTGAAAALVKQNPTGFVVPSVWTGEPDGILASATLGDSTNIWHIPISTRTWRVSGEPARVTSGTSLEDSPSATSGGRLVFASLNRNIDIWMLPIDAAQAKVRGPLTRVTSDASEERAMALSADGNKLVFRSDRSGNNDIWVRDLITGGQTALTATPENEGAARLSADGMVVGYSALIAWGRWPLYVLPTSGGVAEKILEDCRFWNWSSDTKRILHVKSPPPRIFVLNTQSGKDTEYLRHPKYNLYTPSFSPDDRWIAFHGGTGNRASIYIVPYRDGAPIPETEWIAVTDGTARDERASWSPDEASIYFESDRHGFNCLWTQRLDPMSKKPLGSPIPVHDFHTARLSLGNERISRQKIAMTLIDLTGNIWMTSLSPRR